MDTIILSRVGNDEILGLEKASAECALLSHTCLPLGR